MKKQLVFSSVIALGALLALFALPARDAQAQVVFQAAGPDAAAIQGAVDGFRTALGDLNLAGAQLTGRREINWDGGGSTNTTPPVNPFDVFLDSRGARFTAPGGVGLSQAPPTGGAQGGLVVLSNNPAYATDFATFSSPRLFTPVGTRVTEGLFFVPGTNGGTPAGVTGFGAVFTDVDQPNGEIGASRHSTRIEYFDASNRKIYTGFVPAAPGDGNLSFFGVMFTDPIIARVRIVTGDVKPGANDTARDVVMMDDFVYGEPQALP
jgi:hypothetical protein